MQERENVMDEKLEKLKDFIARLRRRSDEAYRGQRGYPECWSDQIDYDEVDDWADELENLFSLKDED